MPPPATTTGLHGRSRAGKTTLATALADFLQCSGITTLLIAGDDLRSSDPPTDAWCVWMRAFDRIVRLLFPPEPGGRSLPEPEGQGLRT